MARAPSFIDGAGRPQTADGVFIVGGETPSVQAVDVVNMSGVTVAGAAQILPADADRFALTVRNASDTKMTFRVDNSEAGSVDYPLDPGRGYEFPENMIPRGAVSVWCGTAGKQWNVMLGTRSDA